MNFVWFLIGCGVASWLSRRERVDANLAAIEDYANYDRDAH